MLGNALVIGLFTALTIPSATAATGATSTSTSTTPLAGTPTITDTISLPLPSFIAQRPTIDSASFHPPPALLLTGSADGYYRYDLARTNRNELTSFTRSNNQVNLGMVSLRLEHRSNRLDWVADLGVGPRQREYAYNDHGIVQSIKQLYITYSPATWLKFTAGTWTTHLCYEVLDASGNRNYSMSYIFSNTIFSHTGVRADFTSGKSGFMIGISNPGDYRSIPSGSFNNKQAIAQYSYSPTDDLKLLLNYVGGRDVLNNRTHQYELILTNKFNNLFSVNFDGSINVSSTAAEKYSNTRTWTGAALYLNLDPKSWLGFTLRTEYFNDPDGQHLTVPSSIFATTFSANFKACGFTLIPEFRIDNASAPIFFYHNDAPAYTAANFLLAAVYSF
jgi:hypothetical protein